MEKIYVITSGEYSDYHILTATTDYKLALEIMNTYNCHIEHSDDTCALEVYKDAGEVLLPFWKVEFDEEGDVVCVCKKDIDPYNFPEVYIAKDKVRTVYLFAKDFKAAMKKAKERAAEALVEREEANDHI